MTTSTFNERLRHAFELRQVKRTTDRVSNLMSATGCARRTALRWLGGRTTPRLGADVIKIAAALDVDAGWLSGNAHDNALLAAVVRKFARLPPELQVDLLLQIERLEASRTH